MSRKPRTVREAAQTIVDLLELGDTRLLAGDGPCGGQPPSLSAAEWGRVYEAAQVIAAAPGGCDHCATLQREVVELSQRLRGRMGEKASAVLDYVTAHPGCISAEIAAALQEPQYHVSQILYRLMKLGHLRRTPRPIHVARMGAPPYEYHVLPLAPTRERRSA